MSVPALDAPLDERNAALFVGAAFLVFGLIGFVFAEAFAAIKFFC